MNHRQAGAVSLFIVIFTALLITIITVSFIRIMLSDQQQATALDLSQSAYDSAQAGVEDAKRALLDYHTACTSGDAASCSAALTLMNSSTCNEALKQVLGGYIPGQEVLIKQNSGDSALQQAYTCVKISLQTPDYLGVLNQGDSKVIPLIGASSFTKVKLEWFSSKDLQLGTTTVNSPVGATTPLLSQADWTSLTSQNRPSIMRTQLMQVSNTGFLLSDFDGSANTASTSDANTLFLYPSGLPGLPALTFASNARKQATSSPVLTSCSSSLGAGGYACSATITLPTPINGTDSSRSAYLRLTALYKNTHYRLTLLDATDQPVQFNGVQPQVDSTGRANDLFRRVESRVEIGDANFPYPDAAVDTTGNFCKDFLVTDSPTDYKDSCTP